LIHASVATIKGSAASLAPDRGVMPGLCREQTVFMCNPRGLGKRYLIAATNHVARIRSVRQRRDEYCQKNEEAEYTVPAAISALLHRSILGQDAGAKKERPDSRQTAYDGQKVKDIHDVMRLVVP
jgi:hypothetical protein